MFLHLQIDNLELFRVIGVKIDKNQNHSFNWALDFGLFEMVLKLMVKIKLYTAAGLSGSFRNTKFDKWY